MHTHLNDKYLGKIRNVYEELNNRQAGLDFFALLCFSGFNSDKYDVVVSAKGLRNDKQGFTYVSGILQKYIRSDDYERLSKIVILEEGTEILWTWHDHLKSIFEKLPSEKPVVLENYSLGNLFVISAYVFCARQPRIRRTSDRMH